MTYKELQKKWILSSEDIMLLKWTHFQLKMLLKLNVKIIGDLYIYTYIYTYKLDEKNMIIFSIFAFIKSE